MKKMKCEVCGSTDIKRVEASIFECQSCGVQYTKEEAQKLLVEIAGKVKIDLSEDIENNIKRGDQYKENGGIEKAKEYYNRALDMDPENSKALERIAIISEMLRFNNYYIIAPKINPHKNVQNFLMQLATTKNIVCDIYKKISIKNIVEKYYTFSFIKGKYECNWSLVACRKYFENQTVYKEEYDPTTKKSRTVPKTEKVAKVEKIPMSGTKIFEASRFALASDSLNKKINSIFEDKEFVEELIDNFDELQDEKYNDYKLKKIQFQDLAKHNSGYTYNGMQLELNIDNAIIFNNKDNMANESHAKALDEIKSGINCDYFEGVSAPRTEISQSVVYVLVPIQIIEYMYEGEIFVAISDLISSPTTMPKIYPCDMDLYEKKESLKSKVAESKGELRSLLNLAAITGVGGIILILASRFIYIEILVAFGLAGIGIAIFTIIKYFMRKNKDAKEYDEELKNAKTQLYSPREKYLSYSYDIFFGNLTDDFSFKEIQALIADNTIELTPGYLVAPSGEIIDFDGVQNDESDVVLEFTQSRKRFKFRDIFIIPFVAYITIIISIYLIAFIIDEELLPILSVPGVMIGLLIFIRSRLNKMTKKLGLTEVPKSDQYLYYLVFGTLCPGALAFIVMFIYFELS